MGASCQNTEMLMSNREVKMIMTWGVQMQGEVGRTAGGENEKG